VVLSLFVNKVLSELDIWFVLLQILGAIYILYLSLRFIVVALKELDGVEERFTFYYGVTLNTINPKFIVMASVLVTQFPVNDGAEIFWFLGLFILINASGNATWLLIGHAGSLLKSYRIAILIQRYLYSIALFATSIYLLTEAGNKLMHSFH
jgi:threonine/homoserine/homoserine lactone efflux protein